MDAAKSIGASDGRIIMRHILPNSMAPYLIIATSGLGAAILIESSLAFLGFGVPPPAPSWGGMLSGSVITFARQAWWVAVAPGLAITIAVFASTSSATPFGCPRPTAQRRQLTGSPPVSAIFAWQHGLWAEIIAQRRVAHRLCPAIVPQKCMLY